MRLLVLAVLLDAAYLARADIVPMYQLYNNAATDFFYTTSPAERAGAIATYGYIDQGIKYYVDDGIVRDVGTAPWQRFYKGWPQTEHFYTWTQADINYVQANGWSYEGNEGHIKTSPTSDTVALYRYNRWNPYTYDLQHYYTTNWMDALQPWMAGWGFDGIVAYVWTAPQSWPYAARFISWSYPAVMEQGVTYPVQIVMRNVGHATWRVNDDLYLATSANNSYWATTFWCIQDQRHRTSGLFMGNRVNVTYDVAPGQDAVFNFSVKPGSCYGSAIGFQFRMIGDRVQFRSEDTPIAPIQVVGPTSVFVQQNVPVAQISGQKYTAKVTFRNVSRDEIWDGASGYDLVVQTPGEFDFTWSTNRIHVPGKVYPGQQITFDILFTGPPKGVHQWRWRMAQGSRFFGQYTDTLNTFSVGSASDLLPDGPAPTSVPTVPFPRQPPF